MACLGTEASQKIKLKLWKKWHVVMLNDDKTTFECIIQVLQTVFGYREDEGYITAMAIHKTGSAIVGTYSKDIALTKQGEAMKIANGEGYPLRLAVEEA